MIIGGNSERNRFQPLFPFYRLGTRFGAGNIDGFNMMSLMLPGVAVTYNGEEIGMTNTDVSWEDTVDPAGLNCGEEHFNVSTACLTVSESLMFLLSQDFMCSRDPERTPMQWDSSDQAGFTKADKAWLPVNENYVTGINVEHQAQAN